MFSYPNAEAVTGELGDKFLSCFTGSVNAAREDYAAFQEWRPSWFANFTARFTSNFIHERIWSHMVSSLDDNDDVVIVDKEPRRELAHAGKYVVRIKRHNSTDMIRSYPTKGALSFWSHETTLDGLERVSLALGYIWDRDEREIREPVLSFRDGKDNPIWAIRFPGADEGWGTQPITWAPIGPSDPTLDLSTVLRPELDDKDTGTE